MGSLAFCKVHDDICRTKIRRDDDECGVEDSVVVALVLDSDGVVALLSTIVVKPLRNFIGLAIGLLRVLVGILDTLKRTWHSHSEVLLGDLGFIFAVDLD